MSRINPLRCTLAMIGLTYTIKANNLRKQVTSGHVEQIIEFGSFWFWVFALISFGLSCFAGVCSGLTIGYMSISKSQMQIWSRSDQQQKRKISIPILQVLSDHHFLLSTLLLANALALQALPIFLDKIVPSYLAIFISTASVVIFGQVLPQTYCVGPHKLKIGYLFAPFVKFLQFILYPFVKPIVLILDKIVDHDQGKLVLNDQKMKSVLLLHNKKQYGYRPQQIQIIQNTIDLKKTKVSQAMIQLQKVYMIPSNAKIDQSLIKDISQRNYSKIPIYQITRQNVIGFVKTKNFMQCDISNPITIKQSKIIQNVNQINKQTNLLDSIDIMKTKKINFAIVTNQSRKCVGIIALKNVFQKIVLKKFDDNDIRVNVHLDKRVRIQNMQQQNEQD